MSIKIAYFDDEPDLCDVFESLFSGPGIEIHTYTDPEKGVREAADGKYHLAFVDFRMPIMNGDKVASLLPPETIKYLVSGEFHLTMPEGFSGHFFKPLDYNRVREIIKEKLAQSNS